jgi:hypothetical protein
MKNKTIKNSATINLFALSFCPAVWGAPGWLAAFKGLFLTRGFLFYSMLSRIELNG